MLALLGALTVVVLLTVIMLNLLSPLVALIVVPIVAALLGGFGLATSKFVLAGISAIAPGRRHVRVRDPVLRHHDRCGNARSDHRPNTRRRRKQAHPHRHGHRPARAADPSRRLRRGLLPRHDSRDAAALRKARHGSPRARLRGVDGGGRQFPAVDRADDPRVGVVAYSRHRRSSIR